MSSASDEAVAHEALAPEVVEDGEPLPVAERKRTVWRILVYVASRQLAEARAVQQRFCAALAAAFKKVLHREEVAVVLVRLEALDIPTVRLSAMSAPAPASPGGYIAFPEDEAFAERDADVLLLLPDVHWASLRGRHAPSTLLPDSSLLSVQLHDDVEQMRRGKERAPLLALVLLPQVGAQHRTRRDPRAADEAPVAPEEDSGGAAESAAQAGEAPDDKAALAARVNEALAEDAQLSPDELRRRMEGDGARLPAASFREAVRGARALRLQRLAEQRVSSGVPSARELLHLLPPALRTGAKGEVREAGAAIVKAEARRLADNQCLYEAADVRHLEGLCAAFEGTFRSTGAVCAVVDECRELSAPALHWQKAPKRKVVMEMVRLLGENLTVREWAGLAPPKAARPRRKRRALAAPAPPEGSA